MESEPPPDPSIPEPPVVEQLEIGAAKTPRWLTTRWFWPGYCLLVVLFLLWVRPWDLWLDAARPTTVALEIHQGTGDSFPDFGCVGAFVMVAEPLPEIPAGWLPCDGRQLDANEYPSLFKALGKRPQEPDAESGAFRLPDCQGLTARVPAGLGPWTTTSSLTFEADDGKAPVEEGPARVDLQETRVHCFIKAK